MLALRHFYCAWALNVGREGRRGGKYSAYHSQLLLIGNIMARCVYTTTDQNRAEQNRGEKVKVSSVQVLGDARLADTLWKRGLAMTHTTFDDFEAIRPRGPSEAIDKDTHSALEYTIWGTS